MNEERRMAADDMRIPDFLRRTDRLSREDVQRIINPLKRDWAPIREHSSREIIVVKINALVVNRAAPVTVHEYEKADASRYFVDMDAFERWYTGPKKGRFLGATSQPTFTDIMLADIKDEPRPHLLSTPKKSLSSSDEDNDIPSKKPKVPTAKTTHNGVSVKGHGEHRSTRAAFAAIGLPDKEHQKFRLLLKREGKKVFTFNGKDYEFTVL